VTGGKSYLEPHVAAGRSDLIIYLGGHEYVVEAKVFRHPKQFTDGQEQLARYCRSLSLGEGWYLVFVPSRLDLERIRVSEGERRIEGVTIHTHLVRYDEDVDFGE
jgi:hypothetical protein